MGEMHLGGFSSELDNAIQEGAEITTVEQIEQFFIDIIKTQYAKEFWEKYKYRPVWETVADLLMDAAKVLNLKNISGLHLYCETCGVKLNESNFGSFGRDIIIIKDPETGFTTELQGDICHATCKSHLRQIQKVEKPYMTFRELATFASLEKYPLSQKRKDYLIYVIKNCLAGLEKLEL